MSVLTLPKVSPETDDSDSIRLAKLVQLGNTGNATAAQILAYLQGASRAKVEAAVVNSPQVWIPTGTSAFNATYRTEYTITANVSALFVHFVGAYNNGGTLVNQAYTFTVALQLADGSGNPTGAPISFKAAGSNTFNVAAGATLKSDALNVLIAAGTKVFIIVYSSGGTVPVSGILSNRSGNNYYNGDGITNYASIVNDQSAAGANCFGPALVTGRVIQTDARAILGVGDSLMANANDSQETQWRGWASRAIRSARGFVNVGVGGIRALGLTSLSSCQLIYYPAQFCDSALLAPGINDIYSDSASAATVEGYIQTIAAMLKAGGIRYVCLCTLKPACTSTDGWITTTNQTTRTGDATRQTYNAWALAQTLPLFDTTFDYGGSLQAAGQPSLLDPGSATVLLTGTAGASTSNAALFTGSLAIGDISMAGATIVWTHSGVLHSGQVSAFRPGTSTTNYLLLTGTTGAFASGDSYTLYDSLCGDDVSSGTHPNGRGHAKVATAFRASAAFTLLTS